MALTSVWKWTFSLNNIYFLIQCWWIWSNFDWIWSISTGYDPKKPACAFELNDNFSMQCEELSDLWRKYLYQNYILNGSFSIVMFKYKEKIIYLTFIIMLTWTCLNIWLQQILQRTIFLYRNFIQFPHKIHSIQVKFERISSNTRQCPLWEVTWKWT